MDFETRIDPNVTNLLDREPITPTDIYPFHSGEGAGGNGLTVAINDPGIGDHPILDYYGVTVERPDIAGLPTSDRDHVGHGTGGHRNGTSQPSHCGDPHRRAHLRWQWPDEDAADRVRLRLSSVAERRDRPG